MKQNMKRLTRKFYLDIINLKFWMKFKKITLNH